MVKSMTNEGNNDYLREHDGITHDESVRGPEAEQRPTDGRLCPNMVVIRGARREASLLDPIDTPTPTWVWQTPLSAMNPYEEHIPHTFIPSTGVTTGAYMRDHDRP